MDITTELQAQGITGYQLTLGSMESDELSLSFTRTPASAPLTFAVGDTYEVGDFSGVVWDIDTAEAAGAPTEVTVSVRGLIGVLETVPCVLLDGLKAGVKSTTKKPELVTVGAVIAAAAKAAAHVGITIESAGLEKHGILMPFTGGTESVWSVLQNALRWVPCARTRCVGKTLYIESGEPEEEEGDGGITYARRVQSSNRSSMDLLPPPVVAARGGQSFEYPSGASIYQPGAFVYRIPEKSNNGVPDDGAGNGAGYGNGGLRGASNEVNGQWMHVRGTKVPPGLTDTTQGVGGGGNVNKDAWKKFWQAHGQAKELDDIPAERYEMGTPFWHFVPGEEVYPDTGEQLPAGGKLGPRLKETSSVPANYADVYKRALSTMCVLADGSFPASTEARGNVRGLTFCKGTITQYVWVKGTTKNEKMLEFFDGTTLVDGKPGRYTCLKMEAIFINRSHKRFQTGTNKLAPGDADYDPTADALGNAGAGAANDWTPDYRAALKAYYDATRELEPVEQSVTLYGVSGFEPGVTTLRQAFAAAGLTGSCGRVSYDAGSRTLTLTNSRRDVLGVDDYLQRQELGRRQAEADDANRAYNVYPAGLMPESSEEEETDETPMISPAVTATHSANKLQAKKVGKNRIFCIGGVWYFNAGTVSIGASKLHLGIISTQYKDGKPAGAFDPEGGKIRFRAYLKGGRRTFDITQEEKEES